jgi:UDP-glucose 4-epimerase
MSLFLVTGGAGFIGSHLCDALLARGDRVRVLDDLSTGKRENLPADAELVVGDIADPDTALHATNEIHGCFHLAAIASVQRGVTDWLGSHRANLTGTIAIFDAIRRHGGKAPVVYASSAAVYGDCESIPIAETATRRPLSAYGADKCGCELHAITASHVHGIPNVGLRFFNVYGPRQDPASPYSGVISIFCEQIPRGQSIQVFGDGAQTRDFVHVSDIVAALLAAMRLRPNAAEVFNVCTGRPTSVLELARTIADLSGTRLQVVHAPPRPGDVRHSLGDPSLARRVLGLTEPVSLRDGLVTVLAALEGTTT